MKTKNFVFAILPALVLLGCEKRQWANQSQHTPIVASQEAALKLAKHAGEYRIMKSLDEDSNSSRFRLVSENVFSRRLKKQFVRHTFYLVGDETSKPSLTRTLDLYYVPKERNWYAAVDTPLASLDEVSDDFLKKQFIPVQAGKSIVNVNHANFRAQLNIQSDSRMQLRLYQKTKVFGIVPSWKKSDYTLEVL